MAEQKSGRFVGRSLTMDGKLVARSDAYEIKASQERPSPPAPMVKASSQNVEPKSGTKSSKTDSR
jgi:hypothetical protein